MTTRRMKLADLHISKSLQPRGGKLDPDTVKDYAARATAGDRFPPLLAFEVTDKRFQGPALVAGFHRYEAFSEAGIEEADVEVRQGTFTDAWLAGYLSNLAHGKRYTNEEKRAAVDTALLLFKDKSARALAEMLLVSPTTVSERRNALVQTNKLDAPKEVVGKTGVTRHVAEQSKDGPHVQFGHVDAGQNDAEPVSEPNPSADGEADECTLEPPVSAAGVVAGEGSAEVEPADPEPADPADEFVATVEALCRDLDKIAERLRDLKASPYSYAIHWQAAVDQVKAVRSGLWNGRPLYRCPYCAANGEVDADCRACRGTDRVYKGTYDRGVAAVGGVAE